ncbi:MAG: hypothetical protein JO372_14775 [Solirubrobacterales bacterium]|nr:hypothetical protein [Solirubrobacterales bacterium]
MEELDLPGQLPGDPEAATGSGAGCEVAGGGIVEATASVDDLADEAAVGPSDADLLDATAMLDGVGRDLGGGEERFERFPSPSPAAISSGAKRSRICSVSRPTGIDRRSGSGSPGGVIRSRTRSGSS